MKVRDAVRKVRNREFPATVMLIGEAEYIRNVAVRELTAAAEVAVPDLNIMTFEGRPQSAALRDALAKPPFMSESKVVVLQRTDVFSSKGPPDLNQLIPQMTVEDHTLFIVDAGERPDKRRQATKHLLATGMVVECNPLKGAELFTYVTALARQRGLQLSRSNAQSLAERCEEDLQLITSELDKLRMVCTGEITAADMDCYSRPVPDAGAYEVQDLFLNGRWDEARRAVDRLLRDDPSPVGFLTMTANALRQMLIARTCRDAHYSRERTQALIMEQTGAREWAARRAYDRCVHLTAATLRRALQRLSEVDFGFKQGQYVLANDLYALLFEIYS